MNINKIICTAILIAALSTLLVNKASALQIRVFAAPNYAGLAPSYPSAWWSGAWQNNGQAFPPNAYGYTANQYAPVNPALPGWALTQVQTNSFLFTGPTQKGSVHGDTWLGYLISGSAGIKISLCHIQWGFGTLRVWQKMWQDAIPTTWKTNTVDLGINEYDLSVFNFPVGLSPIPFRWTNGYNYMTRMVIWAYASANSRVFIEIAKYDDILWITYTSSPEEHWVRSPQQISANPPMGPVGTNVVVNGTGFARESTVYVYYDDGLVSKTLSDGYGNFTTSFRVPPSAKGPHVVRAMDALENTADSFFDVFIEAPPIVGDITGPTPGVPDGKTDMRDVALVARNFGKTDPNVDPPETISAKDISTSMPALALIAVASIGLFRRKKQRKTKQTQHNYETLSTK